MKAAGIPVIPGSKNGINNFDEAVKVAESIGYPVIVKASAGGGGIGMKVVRKTEELYETIESTQRVANHHSGMQRFLSKNTWKCRAILNSRFLRIIMAILSMWATVSALYNEGTRN